MSQLRAFVAHSFLDVDETLVRTFLEHFDRIKDMGIGFTWDHAKAAEAKELAEKVLSLIQDKNILIAICTRSERAIQVADLKPGVLKRKVLGAHESKYSLKTSDWIIQEIGLAIGRGMSLILLMEQGLRPPGGLQGNIEYIEFTRESPERSFGKILDMIGSLRPKAGVAPTPETTSQIPEAERERDRALGDDWFLHPKPEWDKFFYEVAMRLSIGADNVKGQETIAKAYLESAEGQKPGNREAWEARTEYLRLLFGKGGTLNEILRLEASYPQNGQIQSCLGDAYEIYKEYEKAAASYRLASENSASGTEAVENLGKTALALFRAGRKGSSRAAIDEMKTKFTQTGEGETEMIMALREITTLQADNDGYVGLTEHMLELKPDDDDTRFELAYKYSQGNEDSLSFFHYLRIPRNRRQWMTWNNLGVEYEHFDLHVSSVDAYCEAEKLGNTLAMSNLAVKFTSAGFLSEALEICNRALNMKNCDKAIHQRLLDIAEKPETEKKKETEVLNSTGRYSKFYRTYGKAMTMADPPNHVGMWQGPKCRLKIEIKGHEFVAEGRYEVRPAVTAFGLAQIYAGLQSTTTEGPRKYLVKYVGEVTGHAVKASVSVEEEESESVRGLVGTFLTGLGKKTALLVFEDSFAEIRVYEKDAPENERFYTIKQVQDA